MRFKELEESDINYFTEVYYNKDITWDNRFVYYLKDLSAQLGH